MEKVVWDERYYEEWRKKMRNTKIQEPSYEDHRWTEGNLRKYKELAKSEDNHPNRGRKMFFLAETGNVWQNDFLIAAVVLYKKQGFLPEETIEKLFSYQQPVFRVEVMAEKEPGSCEFNAVTYDLIQAAMECNDTTILHRIKKG